MNGVSLKEKILCMTTAVVHAHEYSFFSKSPQISGLPMIPFFSINLLMDIAYWTVSLADLQLRHLSYFQYQSINLRFNVYCRNLQNFSNNFILYLSQKVQHMIF